MSPFCETNSNRKKILPLSEAWNWTLVLEAALKQHKMNLQQSLCKSTATVVSQKWRKSNQKEMSTMKCPLLAHHEVKTNKQTSFAVMVKASLLAANSTFPPTQYCHFDLFFPYWKNYRKQLKYPLHHSWINNSSLSETCFPLFLYFGPKINKRLFLG